MKPNESTVRMRFAIAHIAATIKEPRLPGCNPEFEVCTQDLDAPTLLDIAGRDTSEVEWEEFAKRLATNMREYDEDQKENWKRARVLLRTAERVDKLLVAAAVALEPLRAAQTAIATLQTLMSSQEWTDRIEEARAWPPTGPVSRKERT